MARSGVESVRAIFSWRNAEPAQGAYNWTRLDRLVASAARHRLAGPPQRDRAAALGVAGAEPGVLASAIRTARPAARSRPSCASSSCATARGAASGRRTRACPRCRFASGRSGTSRPRRWLLGSRPWAPGLHGAAQGRLRAIKGADRKAKVVAGSLVAFGNNYNQWNAHARPLPRRGQALLRRGRDPPVHQQPRSAGDTAARTVEIIRRVRAQMRRRGDGRKPIILTEMTWPAASGKVPRRALLPSRPPTKRAEGSRLKAAYAR